MSFTNTKAIIIAGKELEPPAGLSFTNYLDDAVIPFEGRKRRGPVTEIVVHESVTRSAISTVAVLIRRKLGVHLMVAPDGSVTQHGDLADLRLAHAAGHNGPSVGIEIVNPYYAYRINDDLPWKESIPAPWAHRGAYVLPTPEQAEATAQLIGWLTSEAAVGLDIPRKWVGIERGLVRMGSIPGAERPSPGIWAHHYFNHADGAWPVFYAWLRLEAGLDPDSAFETGTIRAAGVRRTIDVLDLTDNWTNRKE